LFFLYRTKSKLFLILSLNILVSIEIKVYTKLSAAKAPKTEASAITLPGGRWLWLQLTKETNLL
jgi:hypothetical protein